MSSARIEFVDLLHVGATSAVYRGTCEGVCGFSRAVAIKVLRSRFAHVPAHAQAFFAEARCAARVRHPCVVDVHAFVETDAGTALVMQLVEGWSLRSVLSTAAVRRRQIPLDVIAAIGLGTAEAVGAVHRAGLVHRDVAPDNLLVTRAGHVIVIDFGSAVVTGRADPVPPVDAGSEFVAPELRSGSAGDRAADVYSLGMVITAMLQTPELARVARGSSPDLRKHSTELDEVLSRATASDFGLRHVHAVELADSLERVLPMPWRGCVGDFLDELFEPGATPAPVRMPEMRTPMPELIEPTGDTRIRLRRVAP